jgi:hypothetical protein
MGLHVPPLLPAVGRLCQAAETPQAVDQVGVLCRLWLWLVGKALQLLWSGCCGGFWALFAPALSTVSHGCFHAQTWLSPVVLFCRFSHAAAALHVDAAVAATLQHDQMFFKLSRKWLQPL